MRNGHYDCIDVHDYYYDEPCCVCKSKIVLKHLVDETNGMGEEIKFKIDKEAEFCTCDKCGNTHLLVPATYKIPIDKENKNESD